MSRPANVRYLESHEWARRDGAEIVVGITDFAVQALGDLTFVDLPAAGKAVTKGAAFGEIESVKAVSDINAPVSGTVVKVNEGLAKDLAPLAADPFGAGWMLRIKPSAPAEFDTLLDGAGYDKVCAEGH